MKRDEILDHLLRYVGDELLHGDSADLDENTPLLEWGVIDSLTLVELVGYVEEELKIPFPDEEVRPEHFLSLRALTDLLLELQRDASDDEGTMQRRAERLGLQPRRVDVGAASGSSLFSPGSRPSWVLLPPPGLPAAAWADVIRSRIGEQRAWALDLPGFDDDQGPEVRGFERAAEHLLGHVEALDAPPSVVIAAGGSAPLALELARRRPTFVEALVLVSYAPVAEPARWLEEHLAQGRGLDAWAAINGRDVGALPPPWRRALEEGLRRPAYSAFFDDDAGRAAAASASVEVPVLLVTGDADPQASATAMRDAARAFVRAEVHHIPRCGAFPLLDRPQELLFEIEQFLQRLAERAPQIVEAA